MPRTRLLILLAMFLVSIMLSPRAYASPVLMSITPVSQAVPQLTTASFTIGLTAASNTNYPSPPYPAGTPRTNIYGLSLAGLPGGTYAFSPNPLPTPGAAGAGAGSASLAINTRNVPVPYCPGSYPFTVTANNVTGADTVSASATLIVVMVGPPLSVSISTNKPTYRINDKVTIQVSVTRPAEGTLTISSPSGSPQTFPFVFYGPTYGATKTITASAIGHWTLSLQADDFCSGFSSSQAAFDVTPDTYDDQFTFSGLPPTVTVGVKVDGQDQGTVSGSDIGKLTFKIDTTHTIVVDQYVKGDPGVRYYCAQNTWTVSSGGTRTFNYATEYEFVVATDPDGITPVTGGGWFSAGAHVQTNQVPATVPGSAGTQYAFKGWEVDGVVQTGNGISLTMDKPHMAVAKYETQYQLLVDSPYGDPKGQGYYAAGSTATFSVTTPYGFPVQQVFVRWEGDYTGTQPQGSITMDQPHVIHAIWTTSYILLIAIVVAAVAIVGGFLFWRKRRGPAPETKPTPPAPGEAEAAAAIKCSSCGAENAADQKFCTNCGEPSKPSKPSKGKKRGLRIGKPEEDS